MTFLPLHLRWDGTDGNVRIGRRSVGTTTTTTNGLLRCGLQNTTPTQRDSVRMRRDGRATTIVDPEMATLLKVVSIEHSSSSIVVTRTSAGMEC